MITDATGATIWTLQGDPFGNSAPTSTLPKLDGLEIKDNTLGFTVQGYIYNQRFAGQTFDKETGLFYNYFRTYDPETARYIEADPIGLGGGWNRYAYVGGNPIGALDPLGLSPDTYRDIGFQAAGIQVINRPSEYDILSKVHDDMLRINLKGNASTGFGPDQYFHCTAFCKISKDQYLSKEKALEWGKFKERIDGTKNLLGLYGSRKLTNAEMQADQQKDLAVNSYGAACPKEIDCKSHCSVYTKGASEKSLTILKNNGY